MSSESTSAAAVKLSAPVIEAEEWAALDATADADNPIPFPESEYWDEDDFDANDSSAEEEQSDEVVQLLVEDDSFSPVVTTHQSTVDKKRRNNAHATTITILFRGGFDC
mmetsp:Transcript_28305/g.48124  ORF Transcript_28305/g.48124 Transcript_28305/m.48124 type:complete len:109 (-) Transcript_28305:1103-1429(-)